MTTLVTGAYGFIGSHVVRALLARGDSVRALHLPSEDLSNLTGLDVEPFAGDITDLESMRAATKGCQRVFHLAGLYAMWARRRERFWTTNVDGTLMVCRAAAEAGVSRVVYTSTIAVTGGQGPEEDATETTSFALAESGDVYSASKFAAHRVVDAFAAMGLDVTTVSPCGPLGPGDVAPTPTGKLLLSAANHPVAAVSRTVVNLGDVRDIAEGHVLAGEKGRRGENYLLGAHNVDMRDLVRVVQRIAFGRTRPVVSIPNPLLRVAGRVATTIADRWTHTAPQLTPEAAKASALGGRADCTKARRELGLPVRPIEESVAAALRFWASRDGYLKSDAVRRRLLNAASDCDAERASGGLS